MREILEWMWDVGEALMIQHRTGGEEALGGIWGLESCTRLCYFLSVEIHSMSEDAQYSGLKISL